MSQSPEFSRNPDYYAARAAEERRLARAAKEPHARDAHLELAEKYERLAEGGGAEPQMVGSQPTAG